MTLTLQWTESGEAAADIIVRFVTDELICLKSGVSIGEDVAKLRGFSAKVGESMTTVDPDGNLKVFVGIGKASEANAETFRRAGAAAARSAKSCSSALVPLYGLDRTSVPVEIAAESLGVGLWLASYSFDQFRNKSQLSSLVTVEFEGADEIVTKKALDRANAIGKAVSLARDLVNTPAGDLAPSDFADIATTVAASAGLEIEVLDELEIAEAKMGGLLGVAAGSVKPPRFVKITYEPKRASGEVTTVALVGKGITFDSGGLSLKSGTGMMTMKTDMGGAAAVLGAMSACSQLDVQVRVVGYMPLTENMPSGSATKPGDVLKTRSGQTIEVLNTDAEGRLVLADALTVAEEDSPDAIIDLATLTGACVVALGAHIAGLLGNDDGLIDQVRGAGRRAGEALWPLPLPTGYHSHIESEIADMKNIGATGQAGSISAALLLERFVGTTPWAHLDIAGPARSEEDRGLLRKGASGFGVRTLISLLEGYVPTGGVRHEGAEGITILP
jgi:leucyl aminopeptidase